MRERKREIEKNVWRKERRQRKRKRRGEVRKKSEREREMCVYCKRSVNVCACERERK